MNYTESALSYDLNFWREDQPSELASEEIYAMLCEEQEVPGLAVIDVDSFLDRICEEFPDATRDAAGLLNWEGKWNSFQASTSPQHVRIDCYGGAGEWMNVFIDIGKEFNCPLYDPQTGERFTL